MMVVTPLITAVIVSRLRDPFVAQKWSLWSAGLTFLLTACAWQDFYFIQSNATPDQMLVMEDSWHDFLTYHDKPIFLLDELGVPLLPLMAISLFSDDAHDAAYENQAVFVCPGIGGRILDAVDVLHKGTAFNHFGAAHRTDLALFGNAQAQTTDQGLSAPHAALCGAAFV